MGKPGRLREQITIEAATRAADGQGGSTLTWATHASVFALVEPLSVKESFSQGAEQNQGTHSVVIRRRSLTPAQDYRFDFGGRLLSIVGELWPSSFGRDYSEYKVTE